VADYSALVYSYFGFSMYYHYQFIEEAERSLHDAIMIVRRAMKNSTVVAGGGAIDV
jgi:chaperonin GroEL (HSP60 family)